MGQGLGVRVGLGVQRVDWGLVLGFRVEAEDYRPARYANRAVVRAAVAPRAADAQLQLRGREAAVRVASCK